MTRLSVNGRVILTGHPKRYEWMSDLTGGVGKVVETKEGGIPAVRISGLADEPFWIAEKHVKAASEEEEGTA
jgi:hypothetical protein